ncbi:MAG: hypothetical protein K8S54_16585 [Spirochaetia bacterium]|nr:hypothetical protein [Spirochaetia bacterium]
MTLEHLNVKIFVKNPESIGDGTEFVNMFHEWIQGGVCSELMLDVADYSHVPAGPGVMLIGHDANYSIDFGDENRPGLLFNRKDKLTGDNVSRIKHVLGQAVLACDRIQKHKNHSKVVFDPTTVIFTVNDRMLAPNSQATFEATKADFQAALANLPGLELSLLSTEPRERFAVKATAKIASLAELSPLVGAQ